MGLRRLVLAASSCAAAASTPAAHGNRRSSLLRAPARGSWKADLIALDTSDYPDALCNDGTPGSFYFRPSSEDAHANSWVISLEGGAECTNNANCQARLRTHLGSSRSYAKTELLEQLASADPHQSPDLHSWNAVRIKYCSSDLFLGTMRGSDAPEWDSVRFSGYNIVTATLDYLSRHHALNRSSRVVLTGESAGGIAVFAHLDALAKRLPDARVVGVPIAGYYWDNTMVYTGPGALTWAKPFSIQDFKEYCGLWRAQLPSRCTSSSEAGDKPWMCALPHYSFRTLESPVFVVEALIDNAQLSFHSYLGSCNANDEAKEFCEEFGHKMVSALDQVVSVAQSNSAQAGLFAPHCIMHTNVEADKPLIGGKSYVQAFGEWYSGAASDAAVLRDECCAPTVAKNPTC